MKVLTKEEVPESERWRYFFENQAYVQKTPTERTLKIVTHCDQIFCSAITEARVTDIRNKYKRGLTPTLLCERHREGRKFETKTGYVVVYYPDHPNAQANGSLYEHVYVMSEHLGRPLAPGENVHHLNGVRNDNRLSNLELWSTSQPSGQRLEDKIRWAIELHDAYPEVWDRVMKGMREESDGTG